MNFKQHFTGGLIVATGSVLALQIIGNSESFIEVTSSWSKIDLNSFATYINIFFIILFSSLAPDLDTASVPQRWFYRASLITLLILLIYKEIEIFIALALYVHMPLLHKHRGWTHYKSTPIFMYISMLIILEYLQAEKSWLYNFKWSRVTDAFFGYYLYGLACCAGHYTHLFLDTKWVRKNKVRRVRTAKKQKN